MPPAWQTRASQDPRQSTLSAFALPRNPSLQPRTSSDKENSITPSASQESRATQNGAKKEPNRRSSGIVVKRNPEAGSGPREHTPEFRSFFGKFAGKSLKGTTWPNSVSSASRSATPKASTSPVKKRGRPRKENSVTRASATDDVMEGVTQQLNEETAKVQAAVVQSGDIQDTPRKGTSQVQKSSPASFVTASDGQASNYASPDTAPTMVKKVATLDVPQSTDDAKDTLKRRHAPEASACARLDEDKPNKRVRSSNALDLAKATVIDITSSSPAPELFKAPTRQTRSASPIKTPSTSFLIKEQTVSESPLSTLGATPSPPSKTTRSTQPPASSAPLPLMSSQRYDSLRSSWKSMVVPSSQSDENLEILDEDEAEDTGLDGQAMEYDDDADLTDVPSSANTIVPQKHDAGEESPRRSSTPMSDYDSDDSLANLEALITGKPVKKAPAPAKTGSIGGAVPLSDDDSDDLPDFSFPTKRPVSPAPAVPAPANDSSTETKRATRLATGSMRSADYRKKSAKFTMTPTQAPQYKFSLANLNKQHQKDLKSRAEIERAQAILAARDQEDEKTAGLEEGNEGTSDLLSKVANQEDGDDNVGKLLQAMGRSDVKQTKLAYHFTNVNDAKWTQPVPEWPRCFPADIEKCSQAKVELLATLDDATFREQAFATGFAKKVLLKVGFVPKVVDWLLQAAICEAREQLSQAYIDCYIAILEASTTDNDASSINESSFVDTPFDEFFPSSEAALDPIGHAINAAPRKPPPQLVHSVRLLGQLAPILSMEKKAAMPRGFACLFADEELMQDIRLKQACSDAFTAIYDITSTTQRIQAATDLFQTTTDTHIQASIIANLPCHTPITHNLRRRVALSYFLYSSKPCDIICLNSDEALDRFPRTIVKTFARDEGLHISDSTHYPTLKARLLLLDAGIDCGFSPTFPLTTTSAKSTTTSSALTTSATSALDVATLKAARAAHNLSLTTLLPPLRRLSTKILDTSAMGSMHKTDAKEAVERLIRRLEFAVMEGVRRRGGGGRAGGIWDDVVGEKKARQSLDGWAVKKPKLEVGRILGEVGTDGTVRNSTSPRVKFDLPDEKDQDVSVSATSEVNASTFSKELDVDTPAEEQAMMTASKLDDETTPTATAAIVTGPEPVATKPEEQPQLDIQMASADADGDDEATIVGENNGMTVVDADDEMTLVNGNDDNM